jgi:hypothetical protein
MLPHMADYVPALPPQLTGVASAEGNQTQAQDWLISLVQSDRYVEDVWAG